MPTYVYKCKDCNTKYEVFHKTIEEEAEIKCPVCESENSQKLITAANFSGFSSVKSVESSSAPSCSSGMCPFI